MSGKLNLTLLIIGISLLLIVLSVEIIILWKFQQRHAERNTSFPQLHRVFTPSTTPTPIVDPNANKGLQYIYRNATTAQLNLKYEGTVVSVTTTPLEGTSSGNLKLDIKSSDNRTYPLAFASDSVNKIKAVLRQGNKNTSIPFTEIKAGDIILIELILNVKNDPTNSLNSGTITIQR